MIVSRWIILRTRNVYDKVLVKNFCSIIFRKSCFLWGKVGKYGRAGQTTDDNIIRRTRFECRISKATNTHSECEILTDFPRQKWLCERAAVLCYTYIFLLLLPCPAKGLLLTFFLHFWSFCLFLWRVWTLSASSSYHSSFSSSFLCVIV